jgi:hypothetical protein
LVLQSLKLDVNGSIQAGSGNTFGGGSNGASIYMSSASGLGLSGNLSGYSRNLIKTDGTSVIEIGQPDTSLISAVNISAGDAAGVIALKTGGNNTRLYINSSGNVGIGTTNPRAPLHVNNSLVDTIIRISKGASTIGNIDLVNEGNRFSIQDDGARRLSIDTSGNVGIGTVSPIQILDVIGKMRITDDVILAQTNGRIDYDNGVAGSLRFFSTSTSAERMRITSAGNIGLGTSVATDRLYIKNTTGDAGIALDNGSQILRLDQNSIRTTTSSQIAIFTNNTVTNGIYINSSGNVGVGTATPNLKFHVTGQSVFGDNNALAVNSDAFCYSSCCSICRNRCYFFKNIRKCWWFTCLRFYRYS